MLDYPEFRKRIETVLSTLPVPVSFENVLFARTPVEYIEVTFQESSAKLLECGTGINMIDGILIISIFTKIGTGTNRAREIAALVVTLLDTPITDISLSEPVLASVGILKDAAHYQHNLSFVFNYVN